MRDGYCGGIADGILTGKLKAYKKFDDIQAYKAAIQIEEKDKSSL